ncbi:hypothetical protein GCM10007173_37480 [Glutamicibacter ardleyensis]|uniref:Uncharacterized protein n=1 Tax=Glutamicibacter ardleyensis TaxID=225894 RepID=A0ABQ2DZP6_9MICC|nr:hypothetical protein GCM10007173_37480 [Glutamicibacter ardleyensis]
MQFVSEMPRKVLRSSSEVKENFANESFEMRFNKIQMNNNVNI